MLFARLGGRAMTKKTKKRSPKTVLKLPDLEHSKTAVLNSLPPLSSRRSYDHAIRDFIDWYCSEPQPHRPKYFRNMRLGRQALTLR